MRVCPECGTRTEEKTCPVDGLITLDESLLESDDPLRGRVIAGKYKFIEEIGAGGMGSVHRAKHVETGGYVAVKVMSPDRADRPTAIKRFHLEAQNAAVLRHANTVRVLDFGVDDGLLYLVMEYLEGAPLSSVLRNEGSLPWARAAHIAKQVLKALWEAHEHPRRIVHRDIKAANIFLCEQVGDPDFVKVVDFGVARSMEGDGAGTKGAIGTPGAMAPEQWSGGGDARSDLYSVGCLLYEMLVGHPPFVVDPNSSDKLMRLAHMHMNQVPAPVRQYVPNAPLGMARLTHALLEKRPEDRPQSAKETVELLDRALYGDELDEYADAVPDIGPMSAQRHVAVGPTESITGDIGTGFDPMGETAAFGDESYEPGTVGGYDDSFDEGADPAAPLPDAVPGASSLPPSHDPVASTIALHEERAGTGDSGDMIDFLRARHASGMQAPTHAAAPDDGGLLPWEVEDGKPAPAAAPEAPNTAARTTGGARSSAPRTRPRVQAENKRFPLGWLVIGLLVAGGGAWLYWAHQNKQLPAAVAKLIGPPPKVDKIAPEVNVPDAPKVAVQPLGDPDDEERGAQPLVVYRARLGDKDHRSERGRKLRHGVDVLIRDRENFHAGTRDIDDGADAIYSDKDKREHLRGLLRKALSRDKALAIVRGHPLVEVQVWPDYAAVAIIEK